MIEVANYDSYAGSGNGFNGCWGTYPFFPLETLFHLIEIVITERASCIFMQGISASLLCDGQCNRWY